MPPRTLPADFFDDKPESTRTLPADFFDGGGSQETTAPAQDAPFWTLAHGGEQSTAGDAVLGTSRGILKGIGRGALLPADLPILIGNALGNAAKGELSFSGVPTLSSLTTDRMVDAINDTELTSPIGRYTELPSEFVGETMGGGVGLLKHLDKGPRLLRWLKPEAADIASDIPAALAMRAAMDIAPDNTLVQTGAAVSGGMGGAAARAGYRGVTGGAQVAKDIMTADPGASVGAQVRAGEEALPGVWETPLVDRQKQMLDAEVAGLQEAAASGTESFNTAVNQTMEGIAPGSSTLQATDVPGMAEAGLKTVKEANEAALELARKPYKAVEEAFPDAAATITENAREVIEDLSSVIEPDSSIYKIADYVSPDVAEDTVELFTSPTAKKTLTKETATPREVSWMDLDAARSDARKIAAAKEANSPRTRAAAEVLVKHIDALEATALGGAGAKQLEEARQGWFKYNEQYKRGALGPMTKKYKGYDAPKRLFNDVTQSRETARNYIDAVSGDPQRLNELQQVTLKKAKASPASWEKLKTTGAAEEIFGLEGVGVVDDLLTLTNDKTALKALAPLLKKGSKQRFAQVIKTKESVEEWLERVKHNEQATKHLQAATLQDIMSEKAATRTKRMTDMMTSGAWGTIFGESAGAAEKFVKVADNSVGHKLMEMAARQGIYKWAAAASTVLAAMGTHGLAAPAVAWGAARVGTKMEESIFKQAGDEHLLAVKLINDPKLAKIVGETPSPQNMKKAAKLVGSIIAKEAQAYGRTGVRAAHIAQSKKDSSSGVKLPSLVSEAQAMENLPVRQENVQTAALPKKLLNYNTKLKRPMRKEYTGYIKSAADNILGKKDMGGRNAEALIKGIIEVESNWTPTAKSDKEARGLMQVVPKWWKKLGVTDWDDPEQNITAGTKIFREYLDRFKDVPLALAAYNMGETALADVMKKTGGKTFAELKEHLPEETQGHVPKVMKAYRRFLAREDLTMEA